MPDWVRQALPELPKVMGAADRKASELAKACSGAVSVFVLHGREGEEFAATVLQLDPVKNRAVVILHEPPVRANCAPAGLKEGSVITVRLLSADPATHTFVVAPVLTGLDPTRGLAADWSRRRDGTLLGMGDDIGQNTAFYYNLTTKQVEREGQSKAKDLLGPFPRPKKRRTRWRSSGSGRNARTPRTAPGGTSSPRQSRRLRADPGHTGPMA